MSLTANQPCVATGATTIKSVDAATFMATYMGIAGTPVPSTRRVNAGGIATGGGDLTADVTITVSTGTTAGTACAGNDSRLSDTRTPTDNTVTTAKIVDANVTAVKMVNAGVFTGDATTTFPALTISNSAITLAKMENRAQATFIGRKSGAGTGVPQEMSASEAATILSGLVPDINAQCMALIW